MRACGGEVVGLTSAAQSEADVAAASWGLDFPVLGDTSCTLVALMNARGWITSVVETGDEVTAEDGRMARGFGMVYETGMLQPGVVALRGAADGDGEANDGGGSGGAAAIPEVLLTWGSVPSSKNVNGAVGRLSAKRAWAAVQRSMDGDFSLSRPAVDQSPRSGRAAPPRPVFWLLLMAHGNFVAPRFFTFDVETAGDSNRGGRSLRGMLGDAARNAALAALATGVGLWRAPAPTVGALAVYAAYFLRPAGPYMQLREMFPDDDDLAVRRRLPSRL